MNCDVPEIIKTISRKRYVKEKLFNQMYNELCAAQREKQDVTNSRTSTEYSTNFCSKYSNNVDQQQKNPMDAAFKLYGENSNGISFWNSVAVNGRRHFKQYHPLTKLNSECLDEQWR